MKITFFSTQPYDKIFFNQQNGQLGFELEFFETHLGPHIVHAITNTDVVCVFVNDKVNEDVIEVLATKGVKIIALRCAGFNNVNIEAAKAKGIKVCTYAYFFTKTSDCIEKRSANYISHWHTNNGLEIK